MQTHSQTKSCKGEGMNDQICYYCKTNPGHKPNNKTIWNGFEDKDTKQFVCWNCHDKHYKEKSKTEFANMCSEYPVIMKF